MSTRIINFMKGNAIAMIALFIALGGTASAATLAVNSVGTKQLKKNAVTTAKIKNNAATTPKIKDAAVTGAKLAAGAVTSDKLATGAVTTGNLAAGAVTGDKVNVATLGKVPSAANADTLGGVSKAVWGTSMMYAGTAFVPRGSGSVYVAAGFGNAGLSVTTSANLFVAPLSLPQGATVTKVTMYYNNTVAGNAGTLYITKYPLAAGSGADILSVASGTASGLGSVSMAPNAVIDNTTNAYALIWWPPSNVNIFGGAKVEYTLPGAIAGPAPSPASGPAAGSPTTIGK